MIAGDTASVERRRVGLVARRIRQRQHMRQVDAAARSGVSQAAWSRFELGGADLQTFRRVDTMLAALGARLDIEIRWGGAAVDRVLDDGHARLAAKVTDRLRRWRWTVQPEVSFSVYGERGSIDLLAWHAPSRSLVVFEIKTELGSVEGLLRPLDAKLRHAAGVARERFGWRPATVSAVVVFPESGAVRRQVARHAGLIGARLPATSREVTAWLGSPAGTIFGVWFLSDSHGTVDTRNPSAIHRVRRTSKART